MDSDLERELEENPEYRRVLAELSPDERLRILRKDFNLQNQLRSKRGYRRVLAKLSAAEKLRILEELRGRVQLQQGVRRAPSLKPLPAAKDTEQESPRPASKARKTVRRLPSQPHAHRFGGRATAGGVRYECRIAAFIAVKMLAGSQSSIWQGIGGDDIFSITMQAPELVDDIVVRLRGDAGERAFISAKERSKAIALTANSSAFVDTMDAFVGQFLQLPISARLMSRFVWAVPACAGRAVTHYLANVLNEYRSGSHTSLSEFCRGRQAGHRKAFEALTGVMRKAWKKQTRSLPTEDELRQLLGQMFVEVYDFSPGERLQREIEGEIRTHIVVDPKQARQTWERLEHFFLQADCYGVPVDRTCLRMALADDGLRLKLPAEYASEITELRSLTVRNLDRLKDHRALCFGRADADTIHIERTEELSALIGGVKVGHLLITGEPGCGKSGLVHALVEALQEEKLPVVLLLAEDNLPPIAHRFDEILANWSGGVRGFIITDALDAVRDVERQKAVRDLLRQVREGQAGWTVVASVREFDLKYSRELREAFPGTGVEPYSSDEFVGVAHFHIPRLRESQLDELVRKRSEIGPFIENARASTKSGGIHRSPFHLRLAADLLRAGINPTLLADWHSPATLMRKFWEIRVGEGPRGSERANALKGICRKMVDTRRMEVSLKAIPLAAPEHNQVKELRSRGIILSPALRQGMQVGADALRFTHHLLHDYAIARSLIPESPAPFCDFAVQEPLLAIFYRQSFMFALEELWDSPGGRIGFWEAGLKLESVPELHSIARILPPLLAARRVADLADLQPLLTAISLADDSNTADLRALRHLASGLQDAREDALRGGATAWCLFAEQLANLLPSKSPIEGPLVHIVGRLNSVSNVSDTIQRLALNAAGRGLLAHHVQKEVSKGWPYAVLVATAAVCRTFDVSPIESEKALLGLLAPERLARFPHADLRGLAGNLKHLGQGGENVVIRLFEAAFAAEPETGQWEERGSAILGMRFQTSDEWNSIHYALAGYYEKHAGENAGLMTEAACIAWNAVARRRGDRRERNENVLTTIPFRGVSCDIIEDYGHIWGREFEHEENRILTHFEKLLRKWAAAGDSPRLNTAIDRFALRNRTSAMWTVFMEVGAEQPRSLGVLLEEVLLESLFLTHPDYAYGGAALLGGLHRAGDDMKREKLETLILDLPQSVRILNDEPRDPMPSWVEHSQNRLLSTLEESNIVLETVRELWRQRSVARALSANERPQGPRVMSHTLSDEEMVERRGINLTDPVNEEMFRLRDALKPLLGRNNNADPSEIERHWPVIQQCERALGRHATTQPKMAEELWGHLVGACENIAVHAGWPKTSERWKTIRRILLKASSDPVPEADDNADDKEDRWPSWGWPSPRLDAACGLPFLAYRLKEADDSVSAALRRLCRDNSFPLRFNLASRLSVLEQPAPELMWELADTVIKHEKKFSVLDALVGSVERLWPRAPEKVRLRLEQLANRASRNAPTDNKIHDSLAHAYLFQFLRTGDEACQAYITSLIAQCDSERASHALLPQLHACRVGGWLTAGDGVKPDIHADIVRARTWSFFSKLLAQAQANLQQLYEVLERLRKTPQSDPAFEEKIKRSMNLVDGIAGQIYFASGAFGERTNKVELLLTSIQLRRFWNEASPILAALAAERHPHTASQIVQTLHHLLPCAPREIFALATKSIRNSAAAGFQHESLAVGDVVRLIQRALTDHREIFQRHLGQESDCLVALLEVLDLFVEAGWAEARQLTHRLEEIYR